MQPLSSPSLTTALDCMGVSEVPPSFRSSDVVPANTNALGLNACRMSGSAQPGVKNLAALKTRIQQLSGSGDVYLVNLRHEPTSFIWGLVISQYAKQNWAFPDADGAEIEQIESQWRTKLAASQGHVHAQMIHSMNDNGTIKHSMTLHGIEPKEIASEVESAAAAGFAYKCFYVLDHSPMTWYQVLAFKEWFTSLSPRPHLHFHCRKGKGRTTEVMTLVDIMLNASQVSLADILERQFNMGGADLRATTGEPPWKVVLIQKRLTQIERFFTLIRSATPTPQRPRFHVVLQLRPANKQVPLPQTDEQPPAKQEQDYGFVLL